MKIGIRVPSPKPGPQINPAFIARAAEQLGFESLWYPEHPVVPVKTSAADPKHDPRDFAHFADPFVALAHASAVTSRIKLGTGITLLPERNPLLLAKEVATLDLFSCGRVLLGVGAGWVREETELMGGHFERRWEQTREAVAALKTLWTTDQAEYRGEFYRFPPVWCHPKPHQQPHPPILIGSNLRGLKRVIAWGDGWLPFALTPAEFERGVRELKRLAAEAERDVATISLSAYHVDADRSLVRQYFDAGAERVIIVRRTQADTENDIKEDLERIAEKLL